MSSELASIRAEVKAWERSFKDQNGKEPTVDDIKKQPAIAQKYKLYKKLSKAANVPSTSTSRPNDQPSTPQRQTLSAPKPQSKLLQTASRIAETTAPLASFNPFSPQKRDKGKQREAIPFNIFGPTSNKFASPRKSQVQAPQRQSCPDPFPLIQPAESSSSVQLPQEPPSAISRARKRLRGEPVSPSPNKEKRRRVLSPASLPFPKLQLHGPDAGSNDSDSSDDGGDFSPNGANSSFVDDSPMKPAANGKAFTFLFEEAVKPMSSTDLFGADASIAKPRRYSHRSRNTLPTMEDDLFSDDFEAKKTVNKPPLKNGPSMKSQSSVLIKSRSKLVQTTLPLVSRSSTRTCKESPPEGRSSMKRSLSELESGRNDASTNDLNIASPPDQFTSASQLLPPSPNPNASSRASGKSKPNDARSQPSRTTSRKKAKVQSNDDSAMEDMGDDDGSSSVKLVHHSRGIRAAPPTEGASSENEDPILNYAKRVRPRGKGSVSPAKPGGSGGVDVVLDDEVGDGDVAITDDDEKVEGNLPDELHRVLMLESLKSKKIVYEEEIIVKGLLSGRRVLHYDPKKGGEIWGAGEDERDDFRGDEERGIDEEEDEWEGDPIPWEIGELSESHYHTEEI